MIPDVDATLQRLLSTELGRLPGCPVYDAAQISFDPPTEAAAAQDGEARVNLYLCDLRENLDLREESFRNVRGPVQESQAGRRRAPVRMDLSYLVTVHAGNDPPTEHRLLADVLSVLLRFLSVPKEYLCGGLDALESGNVPITVGQPEHLDLMNPTGLWQALEGQMRPSLVLVVNAPFDPFETKWTKLVREIGYGVAPGTGVGNAPEKLAEIRASSAGIVLDQQSEKPLPGVRIAIEGYDDATTDSNGLFRILNLPPGKRTLQFGLRGYRGAEMNTTVPPLGRVDQLEPLVVALQPLKPQELQEEGAALTGAARNRADIIGDGPPSLLSFSGRVTLPDGAPAVYVPVRTGSKQGATDGSGAYAFFDMPPGEHEVFAIIPGVGETTVGKHKVAKAK